MKVEFVKDKNGNLEVRADDRVVGWLEDAGVWMWLPDRRLDDINFPDRTFGRDFDVATRFITEQVQRLG
jgi:hypothetical protein